MSGSPLVEILRARDAARIEAPWRALSLRAAPNAFADPDFLLPAFEHLAPRRLIALAVWADEARARLIALAGVLPGLTPFSLARVWRHDLAALPALMVDPACARDAVGALAETLRARGDGAGLLIETVERGSAFALALPKGTEVVASVRRAALPCARGADFRAGLPTKRRKEWGRQRRRLEEAGPLTIDDRPTPERAADFLSIEAAGWKGARGTALSQDPGRLAFARSALARFAARNAASLFMLEQGGRPVAAGVVLRSGRRAYYWKTAFDERLAALSPGVQLTIELSARLERDPTLDLADSCALENHPMIDRLWPARLDLEDCAIPLSAGPVFRLSLRFHRAKRSARAAAKAAVDALRRRRRKPPAD